MLKFDVNSLKQRLHLTVLLSIVFILTSISATYYSDWLSIKTSMIPLIPFPPRWKPSCKIISTA